MRETMKKAMKQTLSLLLITLLISACSSDKSTDQTATSPASSSDAKPSSNQQEAPKKDAKAAQAFDFSYKDIEGNEIKLSDYRGKWVVVNFWATWCTPCRKEMPDFVKFKAQFADQVEILGIDFEDADEQKVKSFIKDFDINYPILVTDVYNPTDFEKNNTRGLPTTLIFNPQGEQHEKRVGPVHYKDLLEMTGLKEPAE